MRYLGAVDFEDFAVGYQDAGRTSLWLVTVEVSHRFHLGEDAGACRKLQFGARPDTKRKGLFLGPGKAGIDRLVPEPCIAKAAQVQPGSVGRRLLRRNGSAAEQGSNHAQRKPPPCPHLPCPRHPEVPARHSAQRLNQNAAFIDYIPGKTLQAFHRRSLAPSRPFGRRIRWQTQGIQTRRCASMPRAACLRQKLLHLKPPPGSILSWR